MKKHILYIITLLFSVIIFTSPSAKAHKVRVFAYESGGEITAEAKFGSDRPAKNSAITVETEDGETLLSGTTDEVGIFRFAIPDAAQKKSMNLSIVVNAGEGHRGAWLLTPADYLEESRSPEMQRAALSPSRLENSTQHQVSDISFRDCEQLAAMVEQIVEKEFAPIKRLLAEDREKKIDIQAILGGLGYIFGLAGIALYFKGKKDGEKK
tara:strand:+ start:161 stop:790 length:630 start_codon:yes stop_codon:yes gene_type:complete